MASLPKEPPEDAGRLSFWMVRTAFALEVSVSVRNVTISVFLNMLAGELRAHGAPNTEVLPGLQ